MPNLVGVWSPNSSTESLAAILQRQLQRVAVPGLRYCEYREISEGLAVGLLDHGILQNGTQPIESTDGSKVLFLDGEIYNTNELKRQLPGCAIRDLATPAQVCMRFIEAHGIDAVKNFKGLFCVILYDRANGELTLISDRFGFRSPFYVHRQSAFIFGSEIKAIAAVDPSPRTMDEIGIVELFIYGSHFGDRSWIDGYARLPPATILTVNREGIKKRSYWTYKYDENAPTHDQPTYYTVYASLMERAVERCLQGSRRIGIFLSGGYDSRVVAAAVPKAYLPMPAFSFGHAESRDVRYAQMLAQRLGFDHRALNDDGPYLYPNCRKIVWRTEGMTSFANTTSIRFHDRIKQEVDIILLGLLGEFGGSHTWPALLIAKSRRAAMDAIFQRFVAGRVENVQRIFAPEFFSAVLPEMEARFYASFDSVANDHPLDVADCWNFMNLQPRGSFQSPSVDRYMFEARAPHLDIDLIDFLLTIRPYSRIEQRVYKKMIAYRFPAIRDIPCTNSGLPINPKFAQEYGVMVMRYVARKTLPWLMDGSVNGEVREREFRDLGEDFRKEPQLVDNLLLPLLKDDVFPSRVFNHSGIQSIITEHYQNHARHDYLLSLLISYGLAAKYFLFDNLEDAPSEMYQA